MTKLRYSVSVGFRKRGNLRKYIAHYLVSIDWKSEIPEKNTDEYDNAILEAVRRVVSKSQYLRGYEIVEPIQLLNYELLYDR